MSPEVLKQLYTLALPRSSFSVISLVLSSALVTGLPAESWGFSYLIQPSTFCDYAYVWGPAGRGQRRKAEGTTASLIGEERSLPWSFRHLPARATTARRQTPFPLLQSGLEGLFSLHLIPLPGFRLPGAFQCQGCGMPEEKWSPHSLPVQWNFQFQSSAVHSNSSLLLQSTCHYLCFVESSNIHSMHAVQGVQLPSPCACSIST